MHSNNTPTVLANLPKRASTSNSTGWTLISRPYVDGGVTGGNLDRPALKRLLEDIDGPQIDGVVIYKVDRLSRSLLDFARLVNRFDQRGQLRVSDAAV